MPFSPPLSTGRTPLSSISAFLLGVILSTSVGCGEDPTINTECSQDSCDDIDGDGYLVSADDCGDHDASIHPDAEDIWYDGIDSDCAGNDDYDQDADGYDIGVDCDDEDADIHPGAPDAWYDGIDSDCAGNSDDDIDGDGYDIGVDCDDTDFDINPGAPDAWYDGIDSDCAGNSDYDQDADGYDAEDFGGDDCDDLSASVYPGAPDAWYDGVDSDCAGDDDNDQDGDGFSLDKDCDDADADIHPDAPDAWYDGIDSDCAGNDDYDQDGDGDDASAYGGTDCDDTDATVNPAEAETCDGTDNNCSGDESDASDAEIYYADVDNDFYGDAASTVAACVRPTGYRTNDLDCDDTDFDINPGAVEVWYDGIDSDCAGDDDYDQDGDGFGIGFDCDDEDADIYPGAPDAWYDGVDSDCAGDDDFDQDADGCQLGDDWDDTDPMVCVEPGLLVDLGTAGSFAILAKSGIDTIPASAITGDIGVSPAAATYITGFSLILDSTTTFSTSTQVTGAVYAADYTTPTPSQMTTAISDMETAFTNAAGRAPDVTELGAGSIGGMTLASGVYKWGTGLLVASDLILDGGASEVWIFQISSDLIVSNGVQMHLTGGALPEHVFWQVEGQIGLGTTAHGEGIFLSQTLIALNTDASVNGRLLAQTAVTLAQSTVIEPAP